MATDLLLHAYAFMNSGDDIVANDLDPEVADFNINIALEQASDKLWDRYLAEEGAPTFDC